MKAVACLVATLTLGLASGALTRWMEMPDPMGGQSRVKTVEEWPSEITRVIRILGPDGSDEPFITLTYQKRE